MSDPTPGLSIAEATRINNRVIEMLAEILPANGYLTDAGARVYRGRSDDFGDARDPDQWPALVVATRSDSPASTLHNRIDLRREIDIDAHVLSNQDDYEPELDAVTQDIRRALMPLVLDESLSTFNARVTRVIWGDTVYAERQAGSELASARLTLTVSYVLTLA